MALDKSEMQLAFENHYGCTWGDPENKRDEQVWAAAWNRLRAKTIRAIEQEVLPKMGRQNRGVKMCIEILNQ